MSKDHQLKAISELIVIDVKYLERNLSEIAQAGPLNEIEVVSMYVVALVNSLLRKPKDFTPNSMVTAMDMAQYLAHDTFATFADTAQQRAYSQAYQPNQLDAQYSINSMQKQQADKGTIDYISLYGVPNTGAMKKSLTNIYVDEFGYLPTKYTEPEPTPDDKPQKTYTFLKNK